MVNDEKLYFYVSPFWRTRTTFECIAQAFPREQFDYNEEPRLREQEWGYLRCNEDFDKVCRERREYGIFYYRFPGGEAASDVYDRINDLLKLVGRGKDSHDYELQLVRIAAKNWMYLDRNRDSLRLSGAYRARYTNPDTEESIIDESAHVKSVKKFRTILEGLFQAMGIPNRVAFECDESRISRR